MPRKTRDRARGRLGLVVASMRPRPDAAENGEEEPVSEGAGDASMRPRPDAAENTLAAHPRLAQAHGLQ